MQLPTPLLRLNKDAYKNQFGHVLIIAGSRRMLGAAALSSLAAMRTGSGLVSLAVPQSLNQTAQQKIDPVIMTLPLRETPQQTFSSLAFADLKKHWSVYQVIALGPGMTTQASTQKFIIKILLQSQSPLVLDADAINALAQDPELLLKARAPVVITPHPGEMARLLGVRKDVLQKDRTRFARQFARDHRCVVLLKGNNTVVASPSGEVHINKTGHQGMATAGSGDVLTGMIASLIGQGIAPFDAGRWGAYLHGLAGESALKNQTCASLIASDIINNIGAVMLRIIKKQSKR
ncbi:MAG: NAD(P)H-hydrate dehydratase [Candidatus Omnitrophica bacterium]|nr:NAD(P)H-hydrate dehydratase [Candidatus Omnitrophota bacterium]